MVVVGLFLDTQFCLFVDTVRSITTVHIKIWKRVGRVHEIESRLTYVRSGVVDGGRTIQPWSQRHVRWWTLKTIIWKQNRGDQTTDKILRKFIKHWWRVKSELPNLWYSAKLEFEILYYKLRGVRFENFTPYKNTVFWLNTMNYRKHKTLN